MNKNGNGSGTQNVTNPHGSEILSDEDTAELPVLNPARFAAAQAADGDNATGMDSAEVRAGDMASNWVRHMEAELERLQQRWMSLDGELQQADAQAAALHAQSAEKDSRIAALNTELTALGQRLDALNVTLGERDDKIASLESERSERDAVIADKARALDTANSRAAILDDRLQAIAGERDELRRAVEQEKLRAVEWRAEKDTIAATGDALRAKLQDLEGYIAGRKDQWSEQSAQLARQKTDLATLEKQLAAGDEKLARRDGQIAELEKRIVELERQCGEAEGRHKEREAAYQEVQALLSAQVSEAERLKAAAASHDRDARKAREEAAGHRDAAAALRDTVATRDATIRQLESRIVDGEREKALTDEHTRALTASIAELETALGRKSSEIEALNTSLGEARGNAAALATEFEKTEALRKHMEERRLEDKKAIEALHRELAQLRVEREKLTEGLAAAEKNIVSLSERLTDAEQAWSELKDVTTAQQERITTLQSDLAEREQVIGAFDRNADRLTSLSRSLHAVPGHSDDGDDEAHVETAVAIGAGHNGGDGIPGDDSILADLGLDDGSQSARRCIMVAIDDEFEDGAEYSLSKPVMTIGRAKNSDIRIQDVIVSRTHARLKAEDDGTFIEDAGSKNGIMVNSRLIERTRLEHGDIVSLGGSHDFRYVELELPAH